MAQQLLAAGACPWRDDEACAQAGTDLQRARRGRRLQSSRRAAARRLAVAGQLPLVA